MESEEWTTAITLALATVLAEALAVALAEALAIDRKPEGPSSSPSPGPHEQAGISVDGGYHSNFVNKPNDSLTCLICLGVARSPLQHETCGKLFCQSCIAELKDKADITVPDCPHCRGRRPKYFTDIKSKHFSPPSLFAVDVFYIGRVFPPSDLKNNTLRYIKHEHEHRKAIFSLVAVR